MSYIGINEYVISANRGNGAETWYYVSTEDSAGVPKVKFTGDLSGARRYDDEDLLRDDLERLPVGNSYRILEIQRCPKCHKEFTEYPAISRKDNETEICPECGLREAMEAFMREKGIEADA
jgi:hypothetical protein